MSLATELMAAGIPAGAAVQIGSSKATGLTASGTTKATALALTATVNVFTTVSSGKGAALPPASGSPPVSIVNGGSNALLVFTNASASDTINSLSTGASFSVTNAKTAVFMPAGNLWVAVLSA